MAEKKNITSIEILVVDCLSTIFRHLSIVERIRIERVSRRWNEVSKSSWSNFKKLNLDARSWGLKPSKFLLDSCKKVTTIQLIEVLKRCGKFLEDVDVTKIEKYEKNLLSVIAFYCPNVKIFVADGIIDGSLTIEGLTDLTENCKNISELRLIFRDSIEDPTCDSKFTCLFKNNKSLRKLQILSAPKITGSCLSNLTLLESLYLNYAFDLELEPRCLLNALKLMSNLKVLNLDIFDDQVNDVLVALRNCSNLEEIDLSSMSTENSTGYPDQDANFGILFKNNQKIKILSLTWFNLKGKCLTDLNADFIEELTLYECKDLDCSYLNKYLSKFSNLKKFSFDVIRDSLDNYNELMKFIGSLVKLKSLALGVDDNERSDFDFSSIATLKNLEELELRSKLITDEHFINFTENLKNLKKLDLYCTEVTDVGLHAITSLPNLEELILIEMHAITDKGFNKMKNLKILKLDCENITSDCLKNILTESIKLEHLLIETYDFIDSVDFLLFANEITKKRSNNIILYVNDMIRQNFLETYELQNKKSLKNITNVKSIKKSPFLEYYDDFYMYGL